CPRFAPFFGANLGYAHLQAGLAATGRFFRYALGEVGIVENRVGMASKGSGYPNVMRLGANAPQPRLASKERTRTWGTGPAI
ncbi:MAG: hypothetical protein ACRD2U_05040, partial [Terriglobales bacterium]